MSHVPQLRTPGVIASELNAPVSRVQYVLRKLDIRPIGRAGTLRLFDQQAVGLVKGELDRISAGKGAVNG